MIASLIQTLAVSLRENERTMTFGELRELLSSVGFEYRTNRGVARGPIRSAYATASDPKVKDAVATAFTDRNGNYRWQ